MTEKCSECGTLYWTEVVCSTCGHKCPNAQHPYHEIKRLRAVVAAGASLLRDCRADISQTARVNQANIDGVELNSPDDAPCLSLIGTHFVHQVGGDQSLRVIKRIECHLREAAEAAKQNQ